MQEENQWTAQLNPVGGQFAGTKHDQVVGVLAQVAFVSRIAQTADEARGGCCSAACAGQNRQDGEKERRREKRRRRSGRGSSTARTMKRDPGREMEGMVPKNGGETRTAPN
jgi:hypothetical protein